MKTLTERMDALLESLLYCELTTNIGIDKAKKMIRQAFKEQDKITRHACAENSLKIKHAEDEDNLDFCSGWDEATVQIHEAIINTKAI